MGRRGDRGGVLADGPRGNAADFGTAPGPYPLFGPGPTVPDPSWFEARLGAYAHDPFKNEKGSVDIGAELVFARLPIATAPGWEWLVPRPTIGIPAAGVRTAVS